ncbi:probable tRNA sulfurtransferase [Firmicutes bacterium CAG:313]|nr:probable tRNA sulfurtransferase [Firmicutes bacterium CAG:313]
MEDHILIRYGELSLKKSNRKQFINKINANIKRALKEFSQLAYESRGLRFYIILNGEDSSKISEILKKIPGIYSFSVVSRCDSNINAIKEQALILVKKEFENGAKTFKVETNRGDKTFPLNSLEISKEVARHLFINLENLKADVHNPNFVLYLDVRQEGTFLFTKIEMGLGGFPAGVLGKTMLMVSGGIDSIVAGYMAVKKGMTIEAIHFAAPPYTSDLAVQKVIDLLETIIPNTEYQAINLHIIPFTEIQKAIYDNCREDYCITIMRRMMYRITEQVAKQLNALAILNGENVGQVASQTLESMATIEDVVRMPVIRPLATFDKQDIVDVSRKIGTYDISIRPYEDCCTVFVPKHPQIKPSLKQAEIEENKIAFNEMINTAVEKRERIVLKNNSHCDYFTYVNKNLNAIDDNLF